MKQARAELCQAQFKLGLGFTWNKIWDIKFIYKQERIRLQEQKEAISLSASKLQINSIKEEESDNKYK